MVERREIARTVAIKIKPSEKNFLELAAKKRGLSFTALLLGGARLIADTQICPVCGKPMSREER